MRAALFDYGVGNVHSLGKALQAAGATVVVTANWNRALAADALVLPGVGAFAAAVEVLSVARAQVRNALIGGLPCLGICLGMQLLFGESEEGVGRGIGLLSGRVHRLEARVVPQMGWNDVQTADDPLFRGVEELVAYHAHSYACEPHDPSAAIAWSFYGGRRITTAVRRGRTWGVQFHPEKSSRPGLRVLENFVELAAGGSTSATARGGRA